MNTLLFPISEYQWLLGGFLAFVALMLALDLGVFHRKAHDVSVKVAAAWSIFWFTLSLAISVGFYFLAHHQFSNNPMYSAIPGFSADAEARRVGMEFLTGFLIEKALAIDNIFIFVMVFAAFGIPTRYQHRVLFFGILGAILFRAIFISISSELMAYHWILVVFGAFLILTGIKMMFVSQKPIDPSNSWQIRMIQRFLPLTTELDGQKFLTIRNGVRMGTPLLAALVLIELSDILFALDSVPAIFAVTREPLIVFISNILAILGLRSLYFMLAGIVDRFVYLKYGLALVLIFVGLKMAWLNSLFDGKFPIHWSLGIIAFLIGGSVMTSLRKTSQTKRKNELAVAPTTKPVSNQA